MSDSIASLQQQLASEKTKAERLQRELDDTKRKLEITRTALREIRDGLASIKK